jgi:excisionase family DNA binding protein
MLTTDVYTPKQIARALGVSESSLKRWCDQGVLPTVRTVGGHRRIPLSAVLEYVRASGRALVRPDVLGLPATSGMGERVVDRARERLVAALSDGDVVVCRQVMFDLHLAGHPISTLGDGVIRPAFEQLGYSWECGNLEVYQERRACEIVSRVLHELELALPQPPVDAPLAMGGTIEGDVYQLATTLVAMVMRQRGWRATSLGAGLPIATMLAAVSAHRPRIFWISVSHVADEARFLAEYEAFFQEASRSVIVAVGGRALNEELRKAMRFSVFCERLSELEAFLGTLSKT